jgi:hypothetical protein
MGAVKSALLLAVLGTVGFCIPQAAQERPTIEGTVIDHTGAPVPRVVVTVECRAKCASATTDRNGRYKLESASDALRIGKVYSVRFQANGFRTLKRKIRVFCCRNVHHVTLELGAAMFVGEVK